MKKATQKEIVYNENKEKLYYHKEQSRPEKFIAPMNDLVEEVYIEFETRYSQPSTIQINDKET